MARITIGQLPPGTQPQQKGLKGLFKGLIPKTTILKDVGKDVGTAKRGLFGKAEAKTREVTQAHLQQLLQTGEEEIELTGEEYKPTGSSPGSPRSAGSPGGAPGVSRASTSDLDEETGEVADARRPVQVMQIQLEKDGDAYDVAIFPDYRNSYPERVGWRSFRYPDGRSGTLRRAPADLDVDFLVYHPASPPRDAQALLDAAEGLYDAIHGAYASGEIDEEEAVAAVGALEDILTITKTVTVRADSRVVNKLLEQRSPMMGPPMLPGPMGPPMIEEHAIVLVEPEQPTTRRDRRAQRREERLTPAESSGMILIGQMEAAPYKMISTDGGGEVDEEDEDEDEEEKAKFAQDFATYAHFLRQGR